MSNLEDDVRQQFLGCAMVTPNGISLREHVHRRGSFWVTMNTRHTGRTVLLDKATVRTLREFLNEVCDDE